MEDTKTKIKNNKKTMVITAGGLSKPINECKKINQVYYFVGNNKVKDSGECYRITVDGVETYYRSGNSNLIWDFEEKTYCFKTPQHVLGVIGFNKITGNFETGFFKVDKSLNIFGPNGIFYSEEEMNKAGLYWDYLTGRFSDKKVEMNAATIRSMFDGGYKKINYMSFPKDVYNAAEMPTKEIDIIKNQWLEKNGKKSVFDKYFFDYTLGAEIETSAGMIPENLLFRYGLLPLKDGSIANHEYTTTIIKDFPFFLLSKIFEATNKYTVANQYCSLHYHIGGAPRTKEFVVAFWSLYYRLQGTLDTLMSPYKRDLNFLANKIVGNGNNRGAKDHCKPIPCFYDPLKINVEETFDNIINFLNDGEMPRVINEKNLNFQHRREGGHKWDFESRYYSVNLLPFLFERKQTIEFRLHVGTTNFDKSFAWLMICIALIEFAKRHTDIILAAKEKIRLTDIVEIFDDGTREGNFLMSWLKEYIRFRSERYNKLIIRHDSYGDEFTNDYKFRFSLNGSHPLTFK
jgi:hypothetical protein